MKFEPIKSRETQSMFYGKRGLSWHISVAYKRNTTTNGYYMRTYVHVLDYAQQSSADFVAILINVLQNIKSECPNVNAAFIRSDNGACYHSAHTIAAIEHISAVSGIKIKRYDKDTVYQNQKIFGTTGRERSL